MKNFDISSLIVSKIYDVYDYSLEADTEAKSTASHSLLIIKKGGRSAYTAGGKTLYADVESIVFIPKDTKYSLYVEARGKCTVIEFDALPDAKASFCSFYFGGEREIFTTLKNLLLFWKLKGPAYHSKCLSELYSLFTQIFTVHSQTYSLAGKYGLIHRSVKFIEANYHRQDLYTPMLAEMSGIGETYYRNIFLSVFSMPPAKYIQLYRVEKAKERLVNSSDSIEEIAVAVGFANSSYFCKVFKSAVGLTPSEFAEKSKTIG